MKICENGVVRRMTTEEVRIHNEQMQANEEITPEERIEALETAFMEFVEVVLNG